MMIGMMAPSVAPTILTYARVGREGNVEGKPLAATGWFATGYFLTWIGFALAATLIQWMIERAGLRFADGKREQCTWRYRADGSGSLPMEPA